MKRNKELCELVVVALKKKIDLTDREIVALEKIVTWALKEKDSDFSAKSYRDKKQSKSTRACQFCGDQTTNWFARCCDKPKCQEKRASALREGRDKA